jgi:acyl-CoA synthetase (AMP-forming)/AMP-acid ligase II
MALFGHAHHGTALITQQERVSYEELLALSNTVAAQVPSRSLVLFVASNTKESLAAYVGFLNHQVVPLMVSPSIESAAFDALLEAYRPEFVWCPNGFPFKGSKAFTLGSYRLSATGFEDGATPHPSLALMLSTSGSTGSQKYVRLSYRNIEANAQSICEYLNITPVERAITTLPFSYSYGLSILNSHLISGATLLLTEQTFFDRGFWDFFREGQATSFGGVPYTYAMLKQLRFGRMDLPSLRSMTQAGGRLGADLQREFATLCNEKGVAFFVMYGQTEATARISYLPPERALDSLGSIGIAIPGGTLSVLDDTGASITTPHTAGELLYQGANVMLGYATMRADVSKGDELAGRLATGDIATFDEEGYYSIVGRKKRFLKIFGNRVNLDELEAVLQGQGISAACTGQDDAMRIFIEQGDATEVQALVSKTTGLYKGAFTVQSIEALPRNTAGKPQYAKLEDLC